MSPNNCSIRVRPGGGELEIRAGLRIARLARGPGGVRRVLDLLAASLDALDQFRALGAGLFGAALLVRLRAVGGEIGRALGLHAVDEIGVHTRRPFLAGDTAYIDGGYGGHRAFQNLFDQTAIIANYVTNGYNGYVTNRDRLTVYYPHYGSNDSIVTSIGYEAGALGRVRCSAWLAAEQGGEPLTARE